VHNLTSPVVFDALFGLEKLGAELALLDADMLDSQRGICPQVVAIRSGSFKQAM